MAHLGLPRPLFIFILSLSLSVALSIVLLSPVNSLAVPSDALSSSAELKSPALQKVHSRRQGHSPAGSSLSTHPTTHSSKYNSSSVQFPNVTSSGLETFSTIDTHIQGLSIEDNSNPWANGTVTLPAGVQFRLWDESTPITTTDPELVKTAPSNVAPTSQSLATVNQISTTTVPTDSTSLYLLAVPLAPKIDFSRPTPTSSKTTPDTKIRPQLDSSEMHHMSVPRWRFRPRPIITGVTIHPTSIPENLISTFFGDLGWARTKGYVIPVDSNGISGWRRVVATEGHRSPEGFVRPNQVSGPMAGPSFPSRLQAPSINSSTPQKTILPTFNSNITYHDNLKIAAIQAFAQLGVVILAVLVVVVGAVTFTCFSSILRWPMKVVHAVRYGDADMLRNAFVPTIFRRGEGRRKEKQEMVDESGFVRDATIGRRYLRGTAEAVIFDGVESSTEGSSINSSSYGGFSSEPSESAMSFSTGTTVEAAHDRDVSLTVAVVKTGSQSKAEGGRLRITNQGS